MSVRRLHSHDLLFPVLLLASLLTLIASIAQAEAPSPRSSWGVARIRSEAREGQVVTLQGRVVSVSRSRFFTLEDVSGKQMISVIPEHLLRETGKPKRGETIRVRGKYDHKTLLDVEKSKKSDSEGIWGIRVSSVDRNVPSSGRNPSPADPMASSAGSDTKAAPAAPMSAVTIGTPNIREELKERLTVARKSALAAQKKLEDANAEWARGEYRKVEGAERETLSGSQKRAQQEHDEAIAAMLPLVEEAHEAGLDPKLIKLYEAGITKPQL